MSRSINRRDLLNLRAVRRGRVVEVSCRDLYMRNLDSEYLSASTRAAEGHEPWMGEPPADFKERAAAPVLQRLRQDLQEAEVVRILDSEWLKASTLHEQVEEILQEFRARGGRVETV